METLPGVIGVKSLVPESQKDSLLVENVSSEQADSGFRSIEDFAVHEWIGNGSFCEVLRCVDSDTGREYAMKRVPKQKNKQHIDQACAMEAHCLRQLERTPHVVSLLWDFDTPHEWVGILELCEGGELWAKVKDCGCILEDESSWYAYQMIEALAAVHGVGIVHRDIKCENYILTKTLTVKLIDFGTAKDATHAEVKPMLLGPQYEHHVGTPNFMAPEAVHGKANDRKSDLWSLGCAIYQLILGAPPFNASMPFVVLQKAQAGELWLPSHGVSPKERDLISQLVQVEPDMRMAARTGQTRRVLTHGMFSASSSRPPMDTQLSCAMRCVARAIASEADAAVALDQRANASMDDEGPPMLFLGGSSPAPQVGEPTRRLLSDLPTVISRSEALEVAREHAAGTVVAVDANAGLGTTTDEAEALVALARSADAFCKTAGALDAWKHTILSIDDDAEAVLSRSCKDQLLRFVLLAEQRCIEAREQPDFGDISDDEDEEDGEEEELEADPTTDDVGTPPSQAKASHEDDDVVPGATSSSAEVLWLQSLAKAPETGIKTVPEASKEEQKRCCSIS